MCKQIGKTMISKNLQNNTITSADYSHMSEIHIVTLNKDKAICRNELFKYNSATDWEILLVFLGAQLWANAAICARMCDGMFVNLLQAVSVR